MNKGRRKRVTSVANPVHTRSTALVNGKDNLGSPLKKEIKVEKKHEKNKRLNQNEIAKSPIGASKPGCITSYFTPKSENRIKTELDDISPMKELFKTDETPVAVPCQNPSTPHRINMPNVGSDDTDVQNLVEGIDKKIFSHPIVAKRGKKSTNTKAKTKLGAGGLQAGDNGVANNNHKVTEYFPIRRSVRKCKKTVLEEKQRDMENKVLCEVEDGLEIKYFVGKGRGIITTREFQKGEFVVEYSGELIDQITAKKREAEYAQDQNTGCYMYYFQHRNHQYCVDATAETSKLGRLVNHCRNGNLIARVVEVGNVPHLVLTAKEDIPVGVELCYDYGDRSRESIRNHPWLVL